jgi:putative nucleotidyltransferase with HDIG domain
MNGTGAPEATVDSTELCGALDSLTIERPAAVQVLATVDDPRADAQKVAAAVELDPPFAAQILKLANSAYYGMSGRVGNAGFAVTVIGFSAVRSLAALHATGLESAQRPKPEGFWTHAAGAAAGCSSVADRYGLTKGDAFAAGLLHDLGTALLHGFDPEGHQRLLDQHGADGAALAAAEAATYGLSHDAAAARVLEAWRFPDAFVQTVADHHRADAHEPPFVTAVRVGDLLAHLTESDDEDARAQLVQAGIPVEQIDELIELTARRTADILVSLPGR